MAQPPSGGVLVSDEAARIAAGFYVPGDEGFVRATMAEFMAGDSRVLIRTGRPNNGSSFWVPTVEFYHRSCLKPGALPVWGGGEIPDYNIAEVIKNAGAPCWDWRTPR